jgi:hypothetical protein
MAKFKKVELEPEKKDPTLGIKVAQIRATINRKLSVYL